MPEGRGGWGGRNIFGGPRKIYELLYRRGEVQGWQKYKAKKGGATESNRKASPAIHCNINLFLNDRSDRYDMMM